ncbi:MAG: hemerythrin family protein [Bdellovibrio sp.]|nr:hemerythrin family protein [Bdellovibrio sp.]
MPKLGRDSIPKKYFKLATLSNDPIVWEAKFNVGIAEIDRQHQDIVKLANEIQDSLATKTRKSGFVLEIMEKLEQYIVEHFAYEEGLMGNTRYPGLGAQKKEHAGFMKYVKELQEQYKNSIIDIRQILRFISSWFIDHIQGSDKRFAEWKSKL